MARPAKGLESGGDTGFRRLGYRNAMNPRDLRALLDPQSDDAPFSLERLLPPQRAALDELDALAPKLFLRPADKKYCEKEIQFVLGLDKQDKIERLRTIVARAFWRADSYATALAQLLSDASDAERFLDPLDRFFEIIADGAGSPFDKGSPYRGLAKAAMPRKAIDILDRQRFESPTEKEGRRDDITFGIAALDSMRRELRGVVESRRQTGATLEDARFFFLLRLAEVFVIWTGRAPDFYFQKNAKKLSKNAKWLQFSTNALNLCMLGDDRIDPLFRRLGSAGPRAEAYEAYMNYRELVASVAQGLGESAEWTKYIIEWELAPPNIEPDSRTTALRERLYQELKAGGLTLEKLRDLRKESSKRANGAEARLGYSFGSFPDEFTEQGREAPNEAPMPRLAKLFYSKNRDFCGGDLPSSDWLTDFQLVPEPLGYDD